MRHRLLKVGALFSAVVIAGSLVGPAALAKKPAEKRGGKKPIATVVSFDAATMQLLLTMKDGSEAGQTVDADAQVKVEHRGNHGHGKGHGNPSRGSLDDLTAGTLVLRMKLKDGVVTKLRLRRVAPPVAEDPADDGSVDDGTGDGTVDDGTVDDGTDDGTVDDGTVDDGTTDGTDGSTDGTDGGL